MPQTKTCAITDKQFTLLDQEIDFCDRMGFPYPDICPEERMRKAMATRNEWKLYPRKCDKTGENILSAYHEGVPFPVYQNEVWWGDSWDGIEYGRDFDFNRPFFEQFQELRNVVPREGTSVFNSENCEYNSHIRKSKNCYLNSLMVSAEDCYYSNWVVVAKDVVDSLMTNQSTLCYQCIDVENGYNCFVCQEIANCSDCLFSFQLRNCKNCIFCTNLNSKEYHIFNKPCTKEEFETKKQELLNGSYETWKQSCEQFREMYQKTIHRYVHSLNGENITGDHLHNSRNCQNCFDGSDNEDCSNSISLSESRDIYSTYSAGWTGCEASHFCGVIRGCSDIAFSTYCWFSNKLRYCDSCISCENCFGCIGLRHKKYCILNKQYTREEYEELVPKIIEHMKSTHSTSSGQVGEWGQFFPPETSVFGYNETSAQEHFPLSKEEALTKGYPWYDYTPPKADVERTIQAQQLPDNIKDIPDDILNWEVQCEITGRPFRIIKQELAFYRKNNLPLPRQHPDQRHHERFLSRNPKKLWERKCDYDNCEETIQSSYDPQRTETVYCEECYLSSVM